MSIKIAFNIVVLYCGSMRCILLLCLFVSVFAWGDLNCDVWSQRDCKQESLLQDPQDQYKTGMKYYIGKRVSRDYEQAYYWYKKSALQGYAPSQFAIGYMYYRGKIGSQRDFVSAYVWFSLSASDDYRLAVLAKDRSRKKLTPIQKEYAEYLIEEVNFQIQQAQQDLKESLQQINKEQEDFKESNRVQQPPLKSYLKIKKDQ